MLLFRNKSLHPHRLSQFGYILKKKRVFEGCGQILKQLQEDLSAKSLLERQY